MHLIVLRDPKAPRTNGRMADLQLAAFPDESRVRDPVLLDVLLLWLQEVVSSTCRPDGEVKVEFECDCWWDEMAL